MAAKKTAEKKRSIEETFALIDEKIEQLEDEDVSLEDAFKGFREGMELVKYCEGAIDKIEKKVQKITENGEMADFE